MLARSLKMLGPPIAFRTLMEALVVATDELEWHTYSRFVGAIMMKSNHRKPITFVGMYFIDEHGEDYRTGHIIAEISDGYYLAQFDCPDNNVPPAPLEVLSAADFSKVCDNCGSRHWQFFPDVKARQRWITWLTSPDPAKDKMGKVVHFKPKPDQPA